MDTPRPNAPGHVESTPEAGPLTPPTMRDNYASPMPNQPGGATPEATAHAQTTGQAGGGTGQEASGGGERSPEEVAKEIGERLKPVLGAAEDAAVKVLDLSAKGLTKLVDSLEERRRPKDPSDLD